MTKRTRYNPNMKHRGYRYLKYANKGVSIAAKAAAAYTIAKGLQRQNNAEYKFLDNPIQNLPTYAGSAAQLNTIPQGITDTTRVGDSIKLQKLRLHGKVSGASNDVVRIMVVHDKQNDLVVPADLLSLVGSVQTPFSPKNHDKRFRSKVLYDRLFNVDVGNQQRVFSKNIDLNFHTQFENGTTTIESGSLKIYFFSSKNIATSTVDLHARVTYTDN